MKKLLLLSIGTITILALSACDDKKNETVSKKIETTTPITKTKKVVEHPRKNLEAHQGTTTQTKQVSQQPDP